MRYLVLLLTVLYSTAWAGVGTVTETVGSTASIQRSKSNISGAKGTGVEMNDAVQTTKGKVGITFTDDTKVQVNENSKLVVDEFVFDPKKQSGKLGVKVALGTVRYASGQIAKNNPQNVAVNTPSATISVRGTDFTATVDELGGSTIILLPSCSQDRVRKPDFDLKTDCKTGKIWVETDAGRVILDQPFQATKVEQPGVKPLQPVVLKLTEDAINNLLIIAPPPELQKKKEVSLDGIDNPLVFDFLKANNLDNELDKQEAQMFQDRLSRNFLDDEFLTNLLDIIDEQLRATQQLLKTTALDANNKLLPDWTKASGVIVTLDTLKVDLCRQVGGDTQCVTVPTNQDSLVSSTMDNIEIRNRVNQGNTGAGTTITLIQR